MVSWSPCRNRSRALRVLRYVTPASKENDEFQHSSQFKQQRRTRSVTYYSRREHSVDPSPLGNARTHKLIFLLIVIIGIRTHSKGSCRRNDAAASMAARFVSHLLLSFKKKGAKLRHDTVVVEQSDDCVRMMGLLPRGALNAQVPAAFKPDDPQVLIYVVQISTARHFQHNPVVLCGDEKCGTDYLGKKSLHSSPARSSVRQRKHCTYCYTVLAP